MMEKVADSASCKLLLIEDDEVDRRTVHRAVSRKSKVYECEFANTLEEAKQLIRIKHFDIIVTDLNLPDSGGLDTITSLLECTRKIPIVVLSGTNDDDVALEAIHFGAQDFIPKEYIRDNGLINRTIRHALERHQLRLGLEATRDRESFLAHYDQCTSLPNRLLLLDRLSQSIIQAQRTQEKFSLCFVDLDRFKEVNDSLGHAAGDEVLRVVSQRMVRMFRESDTIARFGGDEFVIIFNKAHREEHVAPLCENLIAEINKPIPLGAKTTNVGASIGIACYPRHGHSADLLLKHADMAMYEAKKLGKNRLAFFNQNIYEKNKQIYTHEQALREALHTPEKHFKLYYQPKVNLSNGNIDSVEALIRWEHPKLGFITPDKFIPLAENLGLIEQIDDWVLNAACAQARRWRDLGPNIRIGINVSSRSFNRRNFTESIVAPSLKRYNIDGSHLEIEITESLLLEDTSLVNSQLISLKSLGIQIAIDDFGKGYSSLSYLHHFPIDRVKIDGSFICDKSSGNNEKALLKAIIAMGQALGLTVIAECIETQSQLDYLKSLSCHEGQGYFWGRPSPDWSPVKKKSDDQTQRIHANERLQPFVQIARPN